MKIARISALAGLIALGATAFASAADKPPTTTAVGGTISAKPQAAGMGGAMLSKSHNLLASKGVSSKKTSVKGWMASGTATKNTKKS